MKIKKRLKKGQVLAPGSVYTNPASKVGLPWIPELSALDQFRERQRLGLVAFKAAQDSAIVLYRNLTAAALAQYRKA